jgi:hypothetical protein
LPQSNKKALTQDAGIDADSIKDNAVNIIIATVMGVIAFAE